MAEGDFRPLAVPARNDEVRDVATSVNELARQLDELRRAIARAERLSVLGRLSGGLAHHLRNGVAGALMAVQMHRRHCQTADQESLEVALRQLSLTEEHLKRFLAAGQPEEPRRTSFDVCELVDELDSAADADGPAPAASISRGRDRPSLCFCRQMPISFARRS